MAARLLSLLLLTAAIAATFGMLLQRKSSAVLREQIALLDADLRELVALREENARLKAAQPEAADVERLRADHAAAMRLRSELNALREQITRAEATVGETPNAKDGGM